MQGCVPVWHRVAESPFLQVMSASISGHDLVLLRLSHAIPPWSRTGPLVEDVPMQVEGYQEDQSHGSMAAINSSASQPS